MRARKEPNLGPASTKVPFPFIARCWTHIIMRHMQIAPRWNMISCHISLKSPLSKAMIAKWAKVLRLLTVEMPDIIST